MKKTLAVLLATVMLFGLVACGSSSGGGSSQPEEKTEQVEKTEQGKVFNIYAWNEEFKGFF